MTTTADIAVSGIIAWRAPSPSSPAPTRRYAASGLDRSVRPSKVASMPLMSGYRCTTTHSTFTEISYTKLLTLPAGQLGHKPSSKTKDQLARPLGCSTRLANLPVCCSLPSRDANPMDAGGTHSPCK